MTAFDFAASALRVQRAWEAGRICSLVGRAMRARILRAEAAWRSGLLPERDAVRIAQEAEEGAAFFSPVTVLGRRAGPLVVLAGLFVVLLALAEAPAHAAADFPGEGERFLMETRAPDGPGRQRFGRWDAAPDARRGGWTVTVTCGAVSLRDGVETVLLATTARATRSRWGLVGGTLDDVPHALGRVPSFSFEPTEDLRPLVDVTGDVPCPGGRGELSSGD